MTTVKSYRDLEVWQAGMALAVTSFRVTKVFPPDERSGLVSQIRRAAASIPANIAEGHARSPATYRHHVSIALGSQAELETLIELACRLGYVRKETFSTALAETTRVGQMLHGLARALVRTTVE